MFFLKDSKKRFPRARGVAVSEHFIVSLSGAQARLYDTQFNLLHTIKGLQYVYKCIISRDESQLLLISTGNWFYVVSLITYEITRHLIKGKYNDDLRESGCWSLDGKGCLFCVTNRTSLLSALRIYPDIKTGEYRDLLCDKYWLTDICAVPEHNSYLITGLNRDNDKSYLIWYDGEQFREYVLDTDDTIGTAVGVRWIAEQSVCIVRGIDGVCICDATGKMQHTYKNEQILEQIVDVCYSKYNPYIYIGTLSELLCVNADTLEIKESLDCPFGVKRIVEMNGEALLIETWDYVEMIQTTGKESI
jgi:hypothetical protein